MFLILNIAVLTGLFVIMAAGLVIAEKFLVNYGKCRVTVSDNGQEDSVVVEGGGTLLDVLLDAGVEVQNSCGGRGSCGFCKVRAGKGGGELLPTEKPYISRRERTQGTRLACQVRVRGDIQVEVPDYLEVVEEMVRTGTFDEKSNWRFAIRGEEHETK